MDNKNKLQTRLCGILLGAALIINTVAAAQSWQWGKRGGSAFNGVSTTPPEQVVDMATDKWGNLYTFLVIESSGSPTIGSTSLQGYGYKDIVLASFKCDGTLRWKKVIGGGQDVDRPKALRIDSFGNVFITGLAVGGVQQPNQAVHFDADTTLPYSNVKSIFIAKYDTSGNFKWLRQPQPDTAGAASVSYFRTYDVEVDNQGNAYVLTYLGSGLVGGSNIVVPARGVYILKYNSQGVLLSLTQPQMSFSPTTQLSNIRIARMSSGKFIVAGQNTLYAATSASDFYLNGQVVLHSLFVACFDAQWQLLWKKESNDSFSSADYRPLIDAQNNIYIGGNGFQGTSFNGYAFANNNSISPYPQSMPFVMKMDSNGNKIWATNAFVNATPGTNAIAFSGNNVVIAGAYPGTVAWPGYTPILKHTLNQGYDIFIARLNAQTGAVNFMDSLASNFGADDFTTAIASDKNGSIYVGGQFSSQLSVAGTNLISAGGAYDFVIAKYGFSCNCVAPLANFTAATTATKTVQFTYTGTTTAIDSVVWDFGDGQKQKVTTGYTTPIAHTYAANVHYTASATVYSSCGTNTFSKGYALSVGSISALEGVNVYPNPVAENLTIEGAEGAAAIITDATGRQVMHFAVSNPKQAVNLSPLSAGIYILSLRDKAGNRATIRVTRQ